ncbi:MAG TPA: bifunctional 4-hydroxy-2-oxoglutarate aldolase/2-dehydro-3-deoxy-phosphogluconate aldolase [Thermodesulfobacteriaceae bacterium]|nr:bifunctional 4-hydroxy-2-oxoglutarate aldolase/2-dehydro-3-deoxy-phosphogluconate aldolase [Thermodesulfobacteriaceae bacterium]
MSHTRNWKLAPMDVLSASPVVPVMVVEEIQQAVPLAQALVAGGIRILEITLRSDAATEAISVISRHVPDALVGAGTVLNGNDLRKVIDSGATFAISPGITSSLLGAANNGPIPLIPGVSTVSELMRGMELEYRHFKFFPAEPAGGIVMLKSIAGPFPHIKFCPTGGISESNFLDYLALENVACVGGLWIVPKGLIKRGAWDQITALAAETVKSASISSRTP